jgi:hypothetical protein
MTASLVVFVEGHVADTQTKICLVFHVKREEKSAEREKRMCAYSSFLFE